jgi:alkaline phosphatase D
MTAAAGLLFAAPGARPSERAKFSRDPFTLGVASGYPTPDGVVLWTRLAPSPLEPGGGMTVDIVPVEWELAVDESMRRVVRRGTAYATRDWAHSVHVELGGLEPSRDYWYRFTAGGARSATGRTRTAPARDAPHERLRLAVASCQHYGHGYYAAYRHMCNDALDLIVHLGDYIYENTWGTNFVREHGGHECYTLEDYRTRYALYKTDPDLIAAHACAPWMATWDDHEVDNDYADDVSEEDDEPELFLARRAVAYRAYYEHLPLPRRAVPSGAHMRLTAQRAFGDLVNLCVLDGRQYRDPHPCPPPGRRGATRASGCAELAAPREMLGQRQEAWLRARLAESRARWNLLAQGVVMMHLDEDAGPATRYWTDSWNGYPAARARLMRFLHESRVRNPVVLSGDIHAFLVGSVSAVPEDLASPIVASELVTTSISSQALPQKHLDERRAINPNLLLAASEHRGYLRLDVTSDRLRADLIAVDDVRRRDAGSRLLASFAVENDRPPPIAI